MSVNSPNLLSLTGNDCDGQPAAVEDDANTGRNPNFTDVEDYYLARAWGCASEDPRVGTSQKGDAFNQKVCDLYNEEVKAHNAAIIKTFRRNGSTGVPPDLLFEGRLKKKVMARWGTLKAACSKWGSVCKALPKPPSGDSNEELLLEKRNALWKKRQNTKKDFPHMDAYDVLSELPKWNSMDGQKDKSGATGVTDATKKRKAGATNKQKTYRSVGKRAQALNDRIHAITETMDPNGENAPSSTLSGDIASLSSTLSGFADSLTIQMWEPHDRETFLRNQARIKLLQQQKELMALELEVKAMHESGTAASLPPLGGRRGSGDSDDDGDDIGQAVGV